MVSKSISTKRAAKTREQFKRTPAHRKPYTNVLIVCEGTKTEPDYFDGLRNYYQLQTTRIQIAPSKGSSPKSVVSHARMLFEKSVEKGNTFDKVFCVFDKDIHSTYADALSEIHAIKKPPNTFYAITSVPCFEYWLLLHYIYTDKPYSATPGKSVSETVINDLQKHFKGYSKTSSHVFTELIDKLETALQHAERANKAAQINGTDNPSTKVAKLVSYLRDLRRT